MAKLILTERQLCDLEMLLNGSYYPVTSFLNSQDYNNVVNNLQLSDGQFFPIPIVLDVPESQSRKFQLGQTIQLHNSENLPMAELLLTEIYQPDLELESQMTLGTTDRNHPYAKFLLDRSETTFYLSGTLKQLNDFLHSDFHKHRLTPSKSKEIINNNNWKNVIGFQTRNPMHRCHYEVTRYLIQQLESETSESTGLLLTPTVGVTQECDIDYFTRVKCYLALMPRYQQYAHLVLLPLAMRMAGPREALLHAIIRRNYGCTHFIIGRDHAGPSYKPSDPSKNSFYGPYDAHQLALKYQEQLGIKILLMQEMVYLESRQVYLPVDKLTDNEQPKQISGTKFREMLYSGEDIPEWFSFPEVISTLRQHIRTTKQQGICVYFVGLSGSGKTTLVKHLKNKLLEHNLHHRAITILDADQVRQHLSKGLGFSQQDRSTNVQRIGYVASLIVQHGGICLVANIAPYKEDRQVNRQLIEQYGKYLQVYVKTPLEVCKDRDCKGLYHQAERGEIKLTGINDPFEQPNESDLIVESVNYNDLELIVNQIWTRLEKYFD